MGDPAKEPLCTVKELLVFGVFCVVYSSILFSLGPGMGRMGGAASLRWCPVRCRSASLFRPPRFTPTYSSDGLFVRRREPLRHSAPHLGPEQTTPQLALVGTS